VIILGTERLLLRHFEPEDVESLYALYRDPEVRRYFPDGAIGQGSPSRARRSQGQLIAGAENREPGSPQLGEAIAP
jgi:ribosomal-protein-alanine N-acetyltransferase